MSSSPTGGWGRKRGTHRSSWQLDKPLLELSAHKQEEEMKMQNIKLMKKRKKKRKLNQTMFFFKSENGNGYIYAEKITQGKKASIYMLA